MRFAQGHVGPSSAGFFGMPVDKTRRAEGDSLADNALNVKAWPAHNAGSSLSVSLGNSPTLNVPRHPLNRKKMAGLEVWSRKMKFDLESHPIWRDSLTLRRSGPGSDTVLISLSSKASVASWMGRETKGKVLFSSATKVEGGARPTSDSQDTLSRSCMALVLSGETCSFLVPKNASRAQAILNTATPKSSAKIPNACLEGRFELVSEWSD
jgi:hypothetical protein